MIFVKYESGKKLKGVVLCLGGLHVRVAIQGSDDAVEYRLVSGHWISEDCEVVSFEFADGGFPTEDTQDLPTIFAGELHTAAHDRIM
jgi:hypothetical protein